MWGKINSLCCTALPGIQSLQAFKGSVGYDAIEKTAKNELYNNKNFILVRPTNLWSLQIHIKVIYLKGNIIF